MQTHARMRAQKYKHTHAHTAYQSPLRSWAGTATPSPVASGRPQSCSWLQLLQGLPRAEDAGCRPRDVRMQAPESAHVMTMKIHIGALQNTEAGNAGCRPRGVRMQPLESAHVMTVRIYVDAMQRLEMLGAGLTGHACKLPYLSMLC
eukprot:1144026-Pelagomonas_calceolata.AAC.2